MDKHRTRFLASLNARLEQERAQRESEAEAPPIWRRHAGQSDPDREAPAEPPATSRPSPEAGRPVADSPELDEPAAPPRIVASPGAPFRPGPRHEAGEPEQTSIAAVPWSETGMPKALRDAIASVRRVSQGIDEPPRRGLIGYPPPPDDDSIDDEGPFGRPAMDRSDLDRHAPRDEPPFYPRVVAERADDRALHEDPAPYDDTSEANASADEWRGFERDWADERASPDDPASQEEPFDERADAPLLFADDAADDPAFEETEREAVGPDLRQAPQHRLARWREAPPRRRSKLAALVIATVFVVLVGLGFGLLSGAQEVERWVASVGLAPLADAMIGDPQTESARPEPVPGRPTGTSEFEPSPPPDELETVHVAPLPAPPDAEQTPEPTIDGLPLPPPARADQLQEPTASAMPLPPPPKPAPPSSVSAAAPPARDASAGAVDDAVRNAAMALLKAEGTGGPFEPILVKTSVSEPRIFIHYTESAPGSPATAQHLVRQLSAAGFTVEGRPVAFPIPEHSIRYFFDSDRDHAQAVSTQLESQLPGGADVPVLDFTGYEPKPRQGHLEVWLGR